MARIEIDEDELWFVYAALAATVQQISEEPEDVSFVLILQDEAFELIKGFFPDSTTGPDRRTPVEQQPT